MGYPKEVHQQAWTIIQQRQQDSQNDLAARKAEVSRLIPEINQIQQSMIKTAAYISKVVIGDPENASKLIEQLAEENLALQANREELLTQHGFAKDYLVEKHNCTICNDKGYVGVEMCECFRKLLKQQASQRLNYLCDLEDHSFDKFNLDFYPSSPQPDGVIPRQRMSEIFKFTKDYAQTFDTNSNNLLLMGKTGLGKTHLSLSIASEITARGFGVLYTPVQKLFDKLESQKFSYLQDDKIGYSENLNSVLESDLLILDDLGTEFSTSFTQSVLYNIVNSRLINRRPTIISTNLEPQELESAYSQRMASRLNFEYKILRFYGNDIRFLNLKQRHIGGK